MNTPMLPIMLTDSGRRSAQRSGIREEPEGRGTAAEVSATPSRVLTCPEVSMFPPAVFTDADDLEHLIKRCMARLHRLWPHLRHYELCSY